MEIKEYFKKLFKYYIKNESGGNSKPRRWTGINLLGINLRIFSIASLVEFEPK